MSKKYTKKRTHSKNTLDMENRSSEKKPRYYAFGYLVSDY
jgi:hypothetical protein